jgi:type II secretory pathway component PulF
MIKKKQKESLLVQDISFGGVSLSQKVIFAKNMAVMIKSGLSINESLGIIADSMSGKFKKIINNIKKSVEAGRSLSENLRQYPNVFSQIFVNVVYAGEMSGSLDENLEHVAEQLRKEKELAGKIKGAMFYPTIVLIAVFVMGIGISFFVLPKITPLFEGLNIELPITTRGLIWFSKLVQSRGLELFIYLILSVMAFFWLIKQKFSRPVIDWLALHLPVAAPIVSNTNIARFCRTLGTLLKSGLPIDEAIMITRDSASNYYYYCAIDEVSKRLSSGSSLFSLLMKQEKYFPKLVTQMIKVGEESGRLEETLFYLAGYFEEEVDNNTKTLSTTIEPILLIFVGLIVGFLALSIITPIYSITGNIEK